MNRYLMSVCVLILLVMLTACGSQGASSPAPDGVAITIQPETEPLSVGDSTLIVSLQNADGSPIDGATVKVHGNMDHEGMTPVDREVSESVDGEYRVPFVWSMGGGWIVTVTAQLPDNGGEVSQEFEFFVEAVSGDSIINQNNDMQMNMDDDAN